MAMSAWLYEHSVAVPRAARFPIELRLPEGFRPDDLTTWPAVEGRLEFLRGTLLYMPPCGDRQGDVVLSVAHVLGAWVDEHPEFVGSTLEAGMKLGDDVRAADAAVWRRDEVGPQTGQLRRVAPVLAVEVAGLDEEEAVLRDKSAWYLAHGVCTVWVVLPESREVLVLRPGREHRLSIGERVPEAPELPGLAPHVERFFRQLR